MRTGSGFRLFIGMSISAVLFASGCETRSERLRVQTQKALQSRITRSEELFAETGDLGYKMTVDQIGHGLAVLSADLPTSPTLFHAIVIRLGGWPVGSFDVHWMEQGTNVKAIELEVGNEVLRYNVHYDQEHLPRFDQKIERTYLVFFADHVGTHPKLDPSDVLVLSQDTIEELLSGKSTASVRLIFSDDTQSEWLACVPPRPIQTTKSSSNGTSK